MMRHAGCLLVVVLSLGCQVPESESVSPRAPLVDPQLDPLFDPQLFSLDTSAFHTFFESGDSSLVPGEGWSAPEETRHQSEEPITFAWVTAREATFRVTGSPTLPVELAARCLPFAFEGAPRQTLTLQSGDRVLATRALDQEWQDVRIPLPGDVLGARSPELRLVFSYARAVDEVQPGSLDRRQLAAAFQYLAVVPREVRDAEAFLRTPALDPRRRRLGLAAGTSATFALPAASDVTLRLGDLAADCRRCRFEVAHRSAGGDRILWQGKPAAAAELSLSFATPDHGLSRLRLALGADGGPVFDGRRTISVDLPTAFLEARRRRSAPVPASPHVFIYLVDTLRADALTPYGSKRETSPRIADFARDAVTYDHAWSASTWTLPSVVSILTGVYPYRHRIMQGRTAFSEHNVPSLAARLDEVGYESFGLSHSYVASERFGLDTGFHHFQLENQLNLQPLRSQDVRRQLLLGLLERERPADPVFAYLHTVDPHAPYAPQGQDLEYTLEAPGRLPASKYLPHVFIDEDLGEDPREVAHMQALYDGEVRYTDRQFGRFVQMLRFLDLYDDSLIVLLSDHGEEFGEHGGFGHGRTLYEENLKVPLIVKYPRSEWAGRRISERVSTVDLVPTILRSAGVDVDPTLDGKSLRPPDLDALPRSRRFVFAEVNPARSEYQESVDYRSFVLDGIKCIESLAGNDQFGEPVPRWQFFDLRQDPLEQRPLAADAPAAERCRRLMQGWIASRRPPSQAQDSSTDPEALEELRALGYIE